MRVLFFLRGINYDRVFEDFLLELLERGHEVQVALELERRGLPEDKASIFDDLRARYPAFSYEQLPPRTDAWGRAVRSLRHGIDYLRFLEPELAGAEAPRERARDRAPSAVRLPFVRTRVGRRAMRRLLGSLEAAAPVPPALREYVGERRPDVVVVSPLVGLGSPQGDFVRAARELGIPTVLAVASWDNLTNKGVVRDVPTLTIVWNEAQAEEAVRLHGIPRERVVAVGAHTFDHWFKWGPRLSREEFCARIGLDPARPFFLYVGSSAFIVGDETGFVGEWIERLRIDERLGETGVLIRPHPQNVAAWQQADLDDPGRASVWPRAGAAPTTEAKKADYYDSLFHSAGVVGINTSALIEAAIVGRPVFTLVDEHFRRTQEGTAHFSHLSGVLVIARSWDEHLTHLAEVLRAPDAHRDRIERFLRSFVRPHGLDEPAAPRAAVAVETAAEAAVRAERAPAPFRALTAAMTPALAAVTRLRGARSSRSS